jgi:hypothetical protein
MEPFTIDDVKAGLSETSEELLATRPYQVIKFLVDEIDRRNPKIGGAVLLSSEGIFRGNCDLGFQYYQIVGKDYDNTAYIMTFGCKLIYQASMEKAFTRFFPIPAPKPDDKIIILAEGDKGNGSNPESTGATEG